MLTPSVSAASFPFNPFMTQMRRTDSYAGGRSRMADSSTRERSFCAQDSSGLSLESAKTSSRMRLSSPDSSDSIEQNGREPVLRRYIRAVFLIMLYTQVENLERPWNCPRFRNAASRLSCRTSSQSCEFRVIRLAALASPGMQEEKSSFTSRALMLAGRFPASGISPAVLELSLQAKRPSSSRPRRGRETTDSMHAWGHCRITIGSLHTPHPQADETTGARGF